MTEACLAATGAGGGFHGRGGLRAQWLGHMLHVRYQRQAAGDDASFEAEVPLQRALDHRGRAIRLVGRADAVRRGSDGALRVEELKSGLADGLPRARLDAYRLQVAIYAWMLSEDRREPVGAELVWLDGMAAVRRREAVTLDDGARQALLTRALDALVAAEEAALLRRRQARSAAARVRFPHATLRRGQEEIAQAVTGALASGEHLLVEAATGSGKTAAALTPALRHALDEGRRLFVLTASTLQQHLAMETLRRLAPETPLTLAVRIRARERMCATGTLRCDETSCAWATDFAGRLAAARRALPTSLRSAVIEPEAAKAGGDLLELCPFELSLELARQAAVTVCDYNYAFDPGVALPELRDPQARRNAVLLVDEVHALPDRARAALGAALEGDAVRAAIERAALGSGPLHRRQRELLGEVAIWLEERAREALPRGVADSEGCVEQEVSLAALEELEARLDETTRETLATLGDGGAFPEPHPFLEVAFTLYRLHRTFTRGGAGYVSLVGRRGGIARLERFCRDPGPALRPLLAGCHAFVGLSATIPAPEVLADLIGLDPDRRALLRAPSPFGAHQRRLVIDPRIDTTWRRRRRTAPAVAARLAALAAAVPGGCLAVLPSHAALAEVREALSAAPLPVLAQEAGDGEQDRRRLVEGLCRGGPCLLLAVAGGALAEGVDYPAGRLSAVAIVGPCLPAPSVRQALLEELYDERFGRAFEVAYALPGMNRVIQSAGRLLRSEADRGVIALLGRRFLRAPYRELLPDAWLAGRPPEDWVGDPAEVASAYFAEDLRGRATAT